MRELYDRLIAGGEAAIEDLKANRVQEGLQLDFKLKEDPSRPTLADKDKRTLGEALSGFSNSSGGLLVFGVDCRKGSDGVDCVQGTMPIAQIQTFKSAVVELSGLNLQPKHDGIWVEAIPSIRVPGAGYLAVYVERSERRPHRSEAVGHGKYFKRAGSSFFAMEHYDIEDAFSRVAVAELDLAVSEGGWSGGGNARNQEIDLKIRNKSNHLAMYPYIVIDCMQNIHCNVNIVNPANMIATVEHARLVLSGGSNHVIHPGLDMIVAKLILKARKTDLGWLVGDDPLNRTLFSFGYTIGCAASRAVSGRFTMQASVFLH